MADLVVAMRWNSWDRPYRLIRRAASTDTIGRFETETLTQESSVRSNTTVGADPHNKDFCYGNNH